MIAMSTAERRVYLKLKAFLKGVFDDMHKQGDTILKLTTYHIKTLLFWLCEQNKREDTLSVQKLTDFTLAFLLKKYAYEEALALFYT
jgi:hypothetical protein